MMNHESFKKKYLQWNEQTQKWIETHPELENEFTSLSNRPIQRLYTSIDLEKNKPEEDIGLPGEFPYTRGVYPTMYRGRHWTMRQFAGFGTAKDTNQRFHYLLDHGQTGLSTAFHFPTLMGYDSDSPRARGEVGVCGVAIDTLKDMEILFDRIPLDRVTTSMTINPPAAILLCMYVALADQQNVPRNKIGGTIQNDILKEYIAQNSYVFPPKPSMRLIVDTFEYCCKELPKFHPISISGYHIRESGSTAVQELAFTIADGIAYVQAAVERGLKVDDFAPKLSFFWDVHNDFFEEIAKMRAARRMWAKIMRDRFAAQKPESMKMKFHCQTAGVSLTAQQPYNNVVRVTLQALAAVLGGTQSLHTNSLDETLALPSDEAVRIALRTQQIIAYESGVTQTIDPLGGSYYVEKLTDDLEKEAQVYIDKIDSMGGMVKAIELGYPMKERAEASFKFQHQVEKKEKTIVGMNDFLQEDEKPLEILKIDHRIEKEQIAFLKKVKAERDSVAVSETLAELKKAASTDENLLPYILKAVKTYASVGEIMGTLREVFGEYHDPGIL
ncbi:MAG: methylmalonyl-CoA mutase family protein [Deltaproteobacteria bacterium]|nr:methylmalonyl-CoA mutase family protein [Deltaproteobacteria bacterium]